MDPSATLKRILTEPTSADVWQLQGDLLVVGTEAARRARRVARDFYAYLSDLESKVTSRRHSRWSAALATTAVTSVSLHDLLDTQVDVFKRLLASGSAALLEIGAAHQSVQAWEVEAALVHHDAAWKLYDELWDISTIMLPDLPADQRRAHLDKLLTPVVSPDTPPKDKAALLVTLFQVVLAVWLVPVLDVEA